MLRSKPRVGFAFKQALYSKVKSRLRIALVCQTVGLCHPIFCPAVAAGDVI